MQEQLQFIEIDPWEQWLVDPTLQAGSHSACLSNQADRVDLESASCADSGASEVIRAEAGGDNEEAWNVPSPEDLERLLTHIESISPSAEEATSQTQIPVTSNDEPTSVTTLESIDDELREAFIDDARACIGAIEASVLHLDQETNKHEAIIQINRQLHTLKGASASVGLHGLANRLHAIEEKIRYCQQEGQPTSSEFLLENLDWIRSQLSVQLRPNGTGENRRSSSKEPCLASLTTLPAEANDSLALPLVEPLTLDTSDDDESVRVKASQINRLMDLLAGLVMLRNRRQTETTDLREIYHELNAVVSKLKLLSSLTAKTNPFCDRDTEKSSGHSEDSDHACQAEAGSIQLSEIAADVQEMCQRLRDCTRPVAEGNEAVSQFIRQFRQELVELRRAPVSGLFQRLQRAVMDAGRAEGKTVRMECFGAGVTVERSLQQRLYEPLLHIVRNAVCHGIENPQQRQLAGKAATGIITLEAITSADLLSIEVRDDGSGLNFGAIRQKAIERGMLASDYSPTEHELAQFIFHPGFSTRQSANQQAGRGIGMDIVASTLSRLGGWIDVSSTGGKGTTFRLNIPLRSAIDHLMVFRCGTQFYALPLLSVRSAGAIDDQSPTVALSDLFGQNSANKNRPECGLVLNLEYAVDRNTPEKFSQLNLLVDEIVGPEEVVVRPLPSLIRSHPYCLGATLASSGQTVLVLDSRRLLNWLLHHQLVNKAGYGSINQRSANGQANRISTIHRTGTAPARCTDEAIVLVVDDSVSSRKSVVRSLSRYPLKIIEAADGRQALQLLRSNRFTAIFSDLEMPNVDGLELLSEVRSRDYQGRTPFTIISSRQESDFKIKAQELGVTKYLSKPISDAALDSVLLEIPSIACLITPPSTADYTKI